MKITYEELEKLRKFAEDLKTIEHPILDPELVTRVIALLPDYDVNTSHGDRRPTDGEVDHARNTLQRLFYSDVKNAASSIREEIKDLRGSERSEAFDTQLYEACDNAVIYNKDCFDILHGCSWSQWCDAEEKMGELGYDMNSGTLINVLAYHVFEAALREELSDDEEDPTDDEDDTEDEDEDPDEENDVGHPVLDDDDGPAPEHD
jgi:hypothetical protein